MIEQFTLDWKKAFERKTKELVTAMGENDSERVGKITKEVRQMCEDIDLMLEDYQS